MATEEIKEQELIRSIHNLIYNLIQLENLSCIT